MKLIPAQQQDLTSIMQIIKHAQKHLAAQYIDQWQNGYPDEARILEDIGQNESYLVNSKENVTAGIVMFTTNAEPTYKNIEGNWLTLENAKYGVIHRMAVSNNFRKQGVAKFIFSAFEKRLQENAIKSMRIDTHEDNLEMQGLLKHLGYTYCGVIYLANADKRLAYEKLMVDFK